MPLNFAFSQQVFFAGFLAFVIIGLILDLGVFSKKTPGTLPMKHAVIRTVIWIILGLAFALVMYRYYPQTCGIQDNAGLMQYKMHYGGDFRIHRDFQLSSQNFSREIAIKYITGYIIEYSLSIDNLFVIMLIFGSFKVKENLQKNILFWGILGAIVMRFLFIFVGSTLLNHFHWLLYVFGGILLFSGFKLLVRKDEKDEPMDTDSHPVVKFARRFLPISILPNPASFFSKENGRIKVTSLFIVLLVIEFSDVIFAVDSVPAIFGITTDPYVVFFSNIFAIMGLRSLYFLLSAGLAGMHTMKYGLSLILVFIGMKMLLAKWFLIIGFNDYHNLMVIFGIIGLTILSSYIIPAKSSSLDDLNP